MHEIQDTMYQHNRLYQFYISTQARKAILFTTKFIFFKQVSTTALFASGQQSQPTSTKNIFKVYLADKT